MKHERDDFPLPEKHGSGCRPKGLDAAPQARDGFWTDLPAENAATSPETPPGVQRPESLPETQPQHPTAPRELFGGRGFPVSQNGNTAFFPGYPLRPEQMNPLYDSARPKTPDQKIDTDGGAGASHIGRGFSAQTDPQGSWTGVPLSPDTTPVQDADDL